MKKQCHGNNEGFLAWFACEEEIIHERKEAMDEARLPSWKAREGGNDCRGGQVKCKRSWGEILEGNSGYNFQVKLTVFTSSYVFPEWASSCAYFTLLINIERKTPHTQHGNNHLNWEKFNLKERNHLF